MDFWLRFAVISVIIGVVGAVGTFTSLFTQLQNLKEANENLEREIVLLEALREQDATMISRQNEAIEELSLKATPPSFEHPKELQKILIKDKGCEAELEAYKRLFNGH